MTSLKPKRSTASTASAVLMRHTSRENRLGHATSPMSCTPPVAAP